LGGLGRWLQLACSSDALLPRLAFGCALALPSLLFLALRCWPPSLQLTSLNASAALGPLWLVALLWALLLARHLPLGMRRREWCCRVRPGSGCGPGLLGPAGAPIPRDRFCQSLVLLIGAAGSLPAAAAPAARPAPAGGGWPWLVGPGPGGWRSVVVLAPI